MLLPCLRRLVQKNVLTRILDSFRPNIIFFIFSFFVFHVVIFALQFPSPPYTLSEARQSPPSVRTAITAAGTRTLADTFSMGRVYGNVSSSSPSFRESNPVVSFTPQLASVVWTTFAVPRSTGTVGTSAFRERSRKSLLLRGVERLGEQLGAFLLRPVESSDSVLLL